MTFETESVAPIKPADGRIECALARLERAAELRGPAAAVEFASTHGLEADGGFVLVTICPVHGKTTNSIDRAELDTLGVVERARSEHFIDAYVPYDHLTELSQSEGVGYVQRLMRCTVIGDDVGSTGRTIVSEGVALTGADLQHTAGFDGTGIDVAIIDVGFINATNSQANGELPPLYYFYDWTGTGLESTSDHGTAVAENVHEMAPGATLYLIKVGTAADLENAKNQVIANGIEVVNVSLGYFGQPGDGTGAVCGIAEDAYANGVLWVNSAGNNALCHNEGVFTDLDFNSYHEFVPGDDLLRVSLSPTEDVAFYLTWDAWPLTYEDYDLYLYNDIGVLVDFSTTAQNPGLPVEVISYSPPLVPAVYHLAIVSYSTTTVHSYDLIATVGRKFHPLWGGEHYVKSGSILSPGDAVHALAVGAMHRDDWFAGPVACFSSRGPTNDGRIKPEITGPDSCSSFTYQPDWNGTSSAAPHVAGAAALILSELPEVQTVDDIWNWLINNAVDMGAPGQDNVYGHGRLHIPPDTPVEGSFFPVADGSESVTLRWSIGSLAGIVGLNVYRATDLDGPYTKLNAALLDPISPGSYEDTTVWPGGTFWYELRAVYSDGSEETVGTRARVTVPGELAIALHPITPNPIRDEAVISFDVPNGATRARLAVYDLRGRLVRTLVHGEVSPGPHHVSWDTRDVSGTQIASGVYFTRLEVGEETRTRKALLVR